MGEAFRVSDLVVTCPKNFYLDWIAEGDAAGDPYSGEEWGWYIGGARPRINPGGRLYIVACGKLRGYAPVIRVVRHGNKWVIIRRGDAVAVTIPEIIKGFRGWRKPWWTLQDEVPFPDWKTP
jgi:hypothetical protein